MHSERPVPQMATERRAMKLIRLVVEAYLKGGGGGDWRFCLLASSVLVDLAKNNMTKGNFIDLNFVGRNSAASTCYNFVLASLQFALTIRIGKEFLRNSRNFEGTGLDERASYPWIAVTVL